MPYNASRGGHAPGHIREALLGCLDGTEIDPVPRSLIGALWNCTDILPGVYCDELDIRRGSTYAMAVRQLAMLARQRPAPATE